MSRHTPAANTPATVAAIRAAYAAGACQVTLARQFGLAQTTVSQIVRRVTWRATTAAGDPVRGRPGGHRDAEGPRS